ncbi:putative aminopeptidase W07G4.4 isoform X1 [Haliotis rufescens]|uniref:putative aminopeptidase W07G4.4 isoform X1 n=2 Tax=Haliotis rufescens TaxID=6454 RepID=UPI00201F267C|nr:putative aminopeptidase W07G4.4 isoform X1 [Haliotis rufescens]
MSKLKQGCLTFSMEAVGVVACSSLSDTSYDCVVVVTDDVDKLTGVLQELQAPIREYAELDKNYDDVDAVHLIKTDRVPSRRLIFAPTGPVTRDYDDVRRYGEAATKGIKRCLKSGCKRPLLVCTGNGKFPNACAVAALGALHALYVPIEVCEGLPDKKQKAEVLGLFCADGQGEATAATVEAVERGRIVTRDIGGSDPERMAAPRVEEYVRRSLEGTCIKVEVVSDRAVLERDYPCVAAVDRAASVVPRHQARLIFLEYKGEGAIKKNIFLIGKGITYDTGGADIKAGGNMAGMHRDKCGAAAVAGFFKILSILKPPGIRVRGVMGMVRNSVGAEAYVADEIVTSRAGVRVRVGNTDAEGRMVMTDLLCKFKEEASEPGVVDPHIFTIATLTGHAKRTCGDAYSIIMDNGPAGEVDSAHAIQKSGDRFGDPLEVSTIRREDYTIHKGKSEYEDTLQCQIGVGAPQVGRGHQSPAAYMMMASGLDKHGKDSATPLRYSHIDIAGSCGPYPGVPTAAPVVALAAQFVL